MSRRRSNRQTPLTTGGRRSRCINCSILIPKNMRKHSLEVATTGMIKLLQTWITPTQLSSESVLCTECLEVLQDQANGISEANGVSAMPLPAIGHRSVCFSCGISILRATRTYPVRDDRQERNILERHIPLHLISRLERVCAACWRSASREIQRQNQHGSKSPLLSETGTGDIQQQNQHDLKSPLLSETGDFQQQNQNNSKCPLLSETGDFQQQNQHDSKSPLLSETGDFQQQNQNDSKSLLLSETGDFQQQNQHDPKSPLLSKTGTEDLNIPEPPPLTQQSFPIMPVRSKITSSVYRRAANTPNHCIFVDCFESERLLIPTSIKELLLINHKFYVPPGARICSHHLASGRWSELTSQLRDFDGTQFDSIMGMMRRAVNRFVANGRIRNSTNSCKSKSGKISKRENSKPSNCNSK